MPQLGTLRAGVAQASDRVPAWSWGPARYLFHGGCSPLPAALLVTWLPWDPLGRTEGRVRIRGQADG